MAASHQTRPKLVREQYSVALFDEEIKLIRGIAESLRKQGVQIDKRDGTPNKSMLIREAFRIAAEVLGTETGNEKLVELARSFKVKFRTQPPPGSDQSWRTRITRGSQARP